MQTEVIKISDVAAQAADIGRAAAVIRAGGLVVFPTETVYGLGGDGLNAEAAQSIYAAKGRPSDNPLIIHMAEPTEARDYTEPSDAAWALYERLARAFMPGPLTVILPKGENVPSSTTGGLDTVAVRCPSHPVAHALIAAAGVPIAAPSANLSGKPSPTEAGHVIHDLDGRVDMILDGGSSEIGLESTIVKIDEDAEGPYLTLLRPGGITYDALTLVWARVEIARAVSEQLRADEKPLSPGMKYKHYAPTAPLVLLEGAPDEVLAFLRRKQAEEACAILCYDEEAPFLQDGMLLPVGARADVAAHAHTLFARLREADALEPQPTTVYAHLPEKTGLGLALYNRMIRAAAHTVVNVQCTMYNVQWRGQ